VISIGDFNDWDMTQHAIGNSLVTWTDANYSAHNTYAFYLSDIPEMNVQFRDSRGNGTLVQSYGMASPFPGGFDFNAERDTESKSFSVTIP
jgi:hypothetical protein